MVFGLKKRKVTSVRTYGDSALKTEATSIEEINEEILELANSLVESMYAFDGIGLAATQIGVSKRIVALDVPISNKENDTQSLSPGELQLMDQMPLVLINPEIVASNPLTDKCEEGCLSVPEIYAQVERPISVTVKADVLGGTPIMVECGGLLGRAMQHEIDHLDGVLFVDRLDDEELGLVKKKLVKLKKDGKKRSYLRILKG